MVANGNDEQVDAIKEDEGGIPIMSENDSEGESDLDREDKGFREPEIFERAGITCSGRPFEPWRRRRSATVNPQSESKAFQLFLTHEILLQIHRYKNRKMLELRHLSPLPYGFMSTFSYDEVKTGIGIVLYAGADHDDFTQVADL